MAGIERYGSYVPFFRLTRAALGGGKGERAVASYDEDSASMAVEAAREALRGSEGGVDTLLFSTTSPPYAEKLNAATVAAALQLEEGVCALDLGGSSRTGLSSLLAALDLASSGRRVLATTADVVVGAPSGPREAAGGDAAAAFVVGSDDGIARLIGRGATTREVLDVWRTEQMPFARQWEDRFGAEVFEPLVQATVDEALEDAGCEMKDLARVVADGTNPRVLKSFAKKARLSPEQIGADPSMRIGRAGAAAAGLGLAAALDEAKPGDKILVFCAADGVDAAVFEVTSSVDQGRPRHSVGSWIDSKRSDLAYTSYLKWREILPFEPPRRPDPDRPAAPPMQRAERWKFAFVGSRCGNCDSVNLPPQRVCVVCQAVDQMTAEPSADAECRVATYTIDRLAYSLQPPIVAAVVDFTNGGRFNCQLTDVDPDSVGIGDELEMTFRRFFTAGGVHNYFWKARPKR
ncbi:MAG: hydroxymethylglutaryl-CoA synthase [Acidobacteria bacterium]|nr:MAG: hydroxymethylglutaryl-CoA synthase [Acidobacteriota bacterium]REK04603.1 MAG: hydroxymethylglutaryl-CoA synthase [Acidobacteriota bacterium]